MGRLVPGDVIIFAREVIKRATGRHVAGKKLANITSSSSVIFFYRIKCRGLQRVGKRGRQRFRTIRPSEAQPLGRKSEISLNQKKRHGTEINSRCVVTVVCAALQKVNLVVQYIKWTEVPPPEGKKKYGKQNYKRHIDHFAYVSLISSCLALWL